MVKISRYIYLFWAWLFVVGVVVQVFLAGLVVVAMKISWNNHILLGLSLAVPLLILLVTQYLGRNPGPMKRLTWLLFGVYILQVTAIGLRAEAPVISAAHPVFALADFAIGLSLARRAWSLARSVQVPARMQPGFEKSANI